MQNDTVASKNMKKTLKIAVTGGIGSGKSLAMQIFAENGYNTISADEIAKELFNDKEVVKRLKKLFPSAVNDDDTVDRKIIADEVFSDKAKLKALNELTHPLIIKEALYIADRNGGINFIEVPLLFEGGFEKLFDMVIVILRPKDKRVESVIKRSGLSETQVVARMNNQVDYDALDLSSSIVVLNDGSPDELRKKILEIAERI